MIFRKRLPPASTISTNAKAMLQGGLNAARVDPLTSTRAFVVDRNRQSLPPQEEHDESWICAAAGRQKPWAAGPSQGGRSRRKSRLRFGLGPRSHPVAD